MIRVIYLLVLILFGLSMQLVGAQSNKTDSKIEALEEERFEMQEREKAALKIKIKNINRKLEKGKITAEEAQKLKEEAATKTAKNIESRLAIIDNTIALLQRNERVDIDGFSDTRKRVAIKFGDGNYGLIIKEDDKDNKEDIVYDYRSTTDLVIAFGLNNTLVKGQSLNDSPYDSWNSRFFEIGLLRSTRVFKNSNTVRFKYGLSFQFNGLSPKNNNYFVSGNGTNSLQEFPQSLKKSKFRADNLVAPVYFEFGPSKVTKTDNYIRYSTRNKFRLGLGGYAGLNISARQKLKYELDDKKRKDKIKGDYNTTNFIYGVGAYLGFGDTSLYVKYDLNPLFHNQAINQNNISLGMRLEL